MAGVGSPPQSAYSKRGGPSRSETSRRNEGVLGGRGLLLTAQAKLPVRPPASWYSMWTAQKAGRNPTSTATRLTIVGNATRLHLHFKHPIHEVKTGIRVASSLDVWASGGYSVAPPSIGPNGGAPIPADHRRSHHLPEPYGD